MVEQSSRERVLRPPQAIINSTITPNMTFTKTSQKFGQWADSRANTVYGLGFSCESHLAKVGNLWEPFTRVQGVTCFRVYCSSSFSLRKSSPSLRKRRG